MGKAKPRHKRKHKTQPATVPSVKDSESEENELKQSCNEDEEALQNIMEEVQSVNTEERLNGLQLLLTLSEKLASIDGILKCKVLKIVGPLLVDPNEEVQTLSAGVLRNLSACGSVEVLEQLVKDDIMTPLTALLNQYAEWKPESDKCKRTDTLVQVVNILWNLCENDDTALKYFNSANLLSILLRCLDYKTFGLDLTITVCQCLNSVSEDNAEVIATLRHYERDFINLLSITPNRNKLILLKTLVAGIIVNINPTLRWLEPVLYTLSEALEPDVRMFVSQMSKLLPEDTVAPSSKVPDKLEKMINRCDQLADAQIQALEILSNLTASHDDEMDVVSDEEFVSDDEGQVNGWSDARDSQVLALSPEIHEGLAKFYLVERVYRKCEPIPPYVMDKISKCIYTKPLARKLIRLQSRGFLCFNNLVSVVDIELLGGPDKLFNQVDLFARQRLTWRLELNDSESNTELVEAATAAIRAIVLRLASVKYRSIQITPADLQILFEVGRINEPRVQANVIRTVGTLGVLMNRSAKLIKLASKYLIDCLDKQLPLWVTAEAVDALMDMFSEDNTDKVAADVNLVPRLQWLAPRLKSKVRQERKTLGDNYAVVSTVMANLSPFIKYKSARVANLNK